jgi:outer membrane protein assembly factor BamB
LLSACIILFNSCKDVVFNNPLDPDASRAALRVLKVMDTTIAGAGDLAFDGEKLWRVSESGRLYALDMETGLVIRSLLTEGTSGVAFLQNIIYLSNDTNRMWAIEPLSGDSLTQISTVELVPRYLAALDFDLLVFDSRSNGFFRYDPERGDSDFLFKVSGMAAGGITVFKGGVLVTETTTDSVYHFTLGGDLVSAYRSPASGICGVTVDYRDNIYLLTTDGAIYKVSLP